MPGLTARDVGGPAFQTTYTLAYLTDMGYMAPKVAPAMPVVAESVSFYVVPFDLGRRRQNTLAEGFSPAPTSEPPLGLGRFTTRQHRHKTPLLKRTEDNAMRSPTGFKQITALHAMTPSAVLALQWEIELHDAMTNTANYYSAGHYTDLSAAPALQFDQFNTSNPLALIISYCRVVQSHSGMPRSKLVVMMGRSVYDFIVQHTAYAERVKYVKSTLMRDVNESDIAGWLGVKEVWVADSIEVTSNIGATTQTTAFTWGRDVFIFYVDSAPNSVSGTAGSWVTPTVTNLTTDNNSMLPLGGGLPWANRSFPSLDPLGTFYVSEGIWGVGNGARYDDVAHEGIRSAAWIQNAVSVD